MRVLILGGTGEARALAGAIVARFGEQVDVLSSLAGSTRQPARIPGRVRSGGFGGAAKLAAFLRDQRIDLLVDATHPFASRISDSAQAAARTGRITLMRLGRESWRAEPGDRWIEAADSAEAARLLSPLGRRAFLTIGRRGLAPFAVLRDMWFLVRTIEPLEPPAPSMAVIAGRGPFTLDDELRLIDRHRIDVLVTKASGGPATEAKLVAARMRRLPVVMIARPQEAEASDDQASVLRWIAARLRA